MLRRVMLRYTGGNVKLVLYVDRSAGSMDLRQY